MNEQLELNPDTDAYILIRFLGLQSAAFNIFPANVSPAQMVLVGNVLKMQGEDMIRKGQLMDTIREAINAKEPEPDLLVAKGQVLKPNA